VLALSVVFSSAVVYFTLACVRDRMVGHG